MTFRERLVEIVRKKQCKACDEYECNCSGMTEEEVADEIIELFGVE